MSIGIHMDTSTIPVTIAGASTSGSAASSGNAATSSSPMAGAAGAGSGGDSSGSGGASPAVQALKREVAQLQKMLAQEQQQLHAATSGKQGRDPANLARISALQSAVATTVGELESAVSALSTAMLAESGSSSGSLVSTSA